MLTSESVGKLAEALCKVQAVMRPATMTGRNPHLKNKYATLNDVMDAARKPLVENGLAYVQMMTTPPGMEGFVGLTTRLMHVSGEWLQDTVAFPVDPGSNRAVNAAQTAGSTITYMRRYALSSMLGIVADEDTDGNDNRPEQPRPAAKPQPAAKPANGNGNPPFAHEGGLNGKIGAETVKELHHWGVEAYGPDWDEKLVEFLARFKAASVDALTEAQARRLIDGMKEKVG